MLIVYLLLGLTMVQYQNCAPGGEVLDQQSINEKLPVDGIDSVNVGEISFPQNKVAFYIHENAVVSGVCDQSGALISWKLKNSQDEVIERGLAECSLGSFSVELSDRWESYCDDNLTIEAALGAQAQSNIQVEANCN